MVNLQELQADVERCNKVLRAAVVPLTIGLSGCITAEDRLSIDAIAADQITRSHYSRGQIDAILAENACKAQARTLVQISRCEVRR